jgi:sulfur relay (sulfurtransferase) complex TusBCD TusD component (DsrE family)
MVISQVIKQEAVSGGRKTLALVLFTAPYGNQYADHMCRVAKKALELGFAVDIFLYGDAVHTHLVGQKPKNFLNVGDELVQLMEMGANVMSCLICAIARGYIGEYNDVTKSYDSQITLPHVKFVTVQGFVAMIKRADRILMFGSS